MSGYLGLHVAKVLLERGYKVWGTIRNHGKEAAVRQALEVSSDFLGISIARGLSVQLACDSGFQPFVIDFQSPPAISTNAYGEQPCVD